MWPLEGNTSFCLWVWMSKYAEWFWGCLCDHCSSPVFKKRSITTGPNNGTKTTIHTWKSHRLSEPNDHNNFFQLVGPTYDELFKTVTPTITERNINIQEANTSSQHFTITLCYVVTGNTFEDLKFIVLYLYSPLELLCWTHDYCRANRR